MRRPCGRSTGHRSSKRGAAPACSENKRYPTSFRHASSTAAVAMLSLWLTAGKGGSVMPSAIARLAVSASKANRCQGWVTSSSVVPLSVVMRMVVSEGGAFLPGVQGFVSVIVPLVPSMRSSLAILRLAAHATSAVIPDGKVRSAYETSSTPDLPKSAIALIASGFANELPVARPATKQAPVTG